MITFFLAVALVFTILAYFPLVLVVHSRDRARIARRRPINEVLSDAVAEGRLSQDRFEQMMDEIHASMPSLDAPYPKVREWMEYHPK